MKNVYFVLANKSVGKSEYLPYASGCLAAYAWADERIAKRYRCAGMIYRRDPINEALARIIDPDIVAFTCYMWTAEYNRLLARALREKYPGCLIVFGGHDISEQQPLEENYPYPDIFMFGEGERPFKELLLALDRNGSLSDVPNIAYRENGRLRYTRRETYTDLDYPSPYLAGYFDEIVESSPGVDFCITIETNRGCPYQCAYCDWCFTEKIRCFPLEKVFAEMEWCAKHKIDYVYCADGNFGILPRDMEIAQYAVKLKKQYGYPHIFNACYAKNSNDNVFNISKLFFENGLNKAITLAFQTLCDTALKNVNRQNFTVETFSELIRRYNDVGIPTYTELILGLPGETKESFCRGVCQLVEAGQHNAMTVYDCQVFPNALMGSSAYIEKYGIRTKHVKLSCVHVSPNVENEIYEYVDMVVQTNTMTYDEMLDALMFVMFVQCFHHIGMLRYFAVYLRREFGISYYDFYSALVRFAEETEETFLHEMLVRFRAWGADLSKGEWAYVNEKFGDVGWYFDEGLFMEIASHYERFWAEILPFLSGFGVPADVFGELCRYQKFAIRLLGQKEETARFAYDFYSYFATAEPTGYPQLEKRETQLTVTIPEPAVNWFDYGKRVMLFGKKKGAPIRMLDKKNVTATYPTKKNIYFVQANSVYGSDKKTVYFPYAVGCIQAYCMQDRTIANAYTFQKIVYYRKPIKTLVEELKNPYMVMFSCSVWNTEYDKAAAAAIKERYPDCLIVFGGHSISSDGQFLEQYPFIDYLAHRFGEEPIAGLLTALAEGKTPADVPNLSFRETNGAVVTTPYAPQTGTDYPSPYLTGVFDDLLEDDVSFSALLESNRGCPNSCSFCDWSSLRSKVRLFPMERVKAEIDWFVRHNIEFVYCADANFCLFSRDAEIMDYVAFNKQQYGYPKVFRVFFTKNKFDFVFDIGKKLVENGLDKAMTVSFQSMNPEVLENIGRKNISTEDFRKLMLRYNENRISTYSELIIGLPGETYESFCDGLGAMLENGQHFAVNAYPCELLPNSEMGQPWYINQYRIKSIRIPFQVIHSSMQGQDDEITEYGDYVVATYSMNETDWVRSNVFSNYVQGLHNLGLLRAIAIYCRYALGYPYVSFYRDLIEYSRTAPDSLLGRLHDKIHDLCRGVLEQRNAFAAPLPDTDGLLWGFDEILFLEAYRDLPVFYREVKEWLAIRFGRSHVLDALFAYQHDIIKKIGAQQTVIESDYDFYTYFNHIFKNEPTALEGKRIRLAVTDVAPVNSFAQLARETVWYGRNRRETDYSSSHYTPCSVFETTAEP